MPQHILDLLLKAKEDIEFEENFLNGKFWEEVLQPLD